MPYERNLTLVSRAFAAGIRKGLKERYNGHLTIDSTLYYSNLQEFAVKYDKQWIIDETTTVMIKATKLNTPEIALAFPRLQVVELHDLLAICNSVRTAEDIEAELMEEARKVYEGRREAQSLTTSYFEGCLRGVLRIIHQDGFTMPDLPGVRFYGLSRFVLRGRPAHDVVELTISGWNDLGAVMLPHGPIVEHLGALE